MAPPMLQGFPGDQADARLERSPHLRLVSSLPCLLCSVLLQVSSGSPFSTTLLCCLLLRNLT